MGKHAAAHLNSYLNNAAEGVAKTEAPPLSGGGLAQPFPQTKLSGAPAFRVLAGAGSSPSSMKSPALSLKKTEGQGHPIRSEETWWLNANCQVLTAGLADC